MKNKNIDIHDQHVHTKYSFDSSEVVESYLKVSSPNQKYVITTEHMEFNKNNIEYNDPDFSALRNEVSLINSNLEFLFGVEIGYKKDFLLEIKDYIHKNDFDIVLMSVHDDDVIDYIRLPKLNDVEIKYYYQKINETINNIDYNVLAHLDYPFRYHNYFAHEIELDYVETILDNLIMKNIALEFNTTSAFVKNNLDYYIWLFTKYYQRGGKSIVISSDAHSVKLYKYKFKETLNLLNKIGFKTISYFIKRKEYRLMIIDVLKHY